MWVWLCLCTPNPCSICFPISAFAHASCFHGVHPLQQLDLHSPAALMAFPAVTSRKVLYHRWGFQYPIGNTPAKAVLPAGDSAPADCKVGTDSTAQIAHHRSELANKLHARPYVLRCCSTSCGLIQMNKTSFASNGFLQQCPAAAALASRPARAALTDRHLWPPDNCRCFY